MTAFFSVLSFLKVNIKWVAIIVLVLAGLFLLYRYNKMVSELATAQHIIGQLEQNIKDKDETIKLERDLRTILEAALADIQRENEKLNETLENITNDLGEDANDLAAKSLREALRRLWNIP